MGWRNDIFHISMMPTTCNEPHPTTTGWLDGSFLGELKHPTILYVEYFHVGRYLDHKHNVFYFFPWA